MRYKHLRHCRLDKESDMEVAIKVIDLEDV